MIAYDLPEREKSPTQLIERIDGRYYSRAEVDKRIHEMEKDLRRAKYLAHIAASNPIISRMYRALGISKQLLDDAAE